MTKALFVDYTGTIIQEKGKDIEQLIYDIVSNSNFKEAEEALTWWFTNLHELEAKSIGDNFMNEDEICYEILRRAQNEYRLKANIENLHTLNQNFWMYAPLFDDVEEFFREAHMPIYVVTNNGNSYVNVCMKRNHLHPNGIISANDARACKPNKELLEKALKITGFAKKDVIYIGDSIESDIKCAQNTGIEAILLDRKSKYRDAKCKRVRSLIEVITMFNN